MDIHKDNDRNPYCRPLKPQRGAALLVLMLVLIIGSTYLLASKLNADQNKAKADEQTVRILNIAKDALIAHSVTYPDRSARGPGYLLCPDKDNDGASNNSCSLSGINPTTGWLPFKSLELPDIRDSSGNRLWYALSTQYRNFLLPPLNSMQVSTDPLIVDGNSNNDIVAVIIAPGKPLNNQHRGADTNNAADDVQHYLEGANKDRYTPDFVTTLGGSKSNDGEYDGNGHLIFNDRLVFITKQELMAVAEKRVLGEVKQVLSVYQQTAGNYPWLAPVIDPPSASTFQSQEFTYEGHIPLLDINGNQLSSSWFTEWFIANEWHHWVTIRYAIELPLPGAVPCTPANDCLTLGNTHDIRALARINQQVKLIAISP